MKQIGLRVNHEKDPDGSCTRAVREILSRYPCRIVPCEDEKDFSNEMDLMIVLGGDGTLIRAAQYTRGRQIPLVGVNLGRRGYLAEIEPNELDRLGQIFTDDYQIEDRMMLSVEHVTPSGIERSHALNEAVIANGQVSRICDLTLLCDERPAGVFRGDGIIVATPTGSTAYSLSAGGPIVDPRIACFCVTPICCHSLYAKSLIFRGESVLTVSCKDSDAEIFLTLDGYINRPLKAGEEVRIRRSSVTTRLLRLKDQSFSEILSRKMSEV